MTVPTVTETTLPPEPVSRDPFIDDVRAGLAAPPSPPPSGRRHIVD